MAREPTHGYALYAEIERWPLPDALRPGRSTVYRHLDRLSEAGHIAPHDVVATAASRHPERTIYAATPSGVAEFDRHARTMPVSFDDLCLRLSTARPEDLPLLADYAAHLERASLSRFQEWSLMGDPRSLVQRGAPWRTVVQTLVARTQAADVASLATILGDLRAELEALNEHAPAQER
ncbi:PadR family transcriptional regulator [Baekduia alba]|uniref:PadR family transcriptional regulator n=1 Tax=Baekduia alba TaxID=2997333 RepID=UPI002340275B|nr:PadR family transcriptional regulator [Baekduia alba]